MEPLFLNVWHRHVAPDLSLHRVRTLGGSVKDLEAQLDDAVATARAAGVLWGKIGRAFGISRQGAQSAGKLYLGRYLHKRKTAGVWHYRPKHPGTCALRCVPVSHDDIVLEVLDADARPAPPT